MFKIIKLKRIKKDLKKNIKINLKEIKLIINNKIKKLILIIGPCSLSNVKEFFFYVKKIKKIKKILIIIRVYYEKPRTNIGWKGYIYDPYVDNSYCINDSFYIIRKLMIKLICMKIKIAVECLNFYFLNYFLDLISWVCIGARNMLCQLHREFCSNLKCPIGIKNDISGNINYCVDSLKSINNKHCFINFYENEYINFSKGNKYCQFVLRGGDEPNYNISIVSKINTSIIIDCSHSNSIKIAKNQIFVFENVLNKYFYKCTKINGLMIESYLKYGNQNILNKNKFISITDSCIDIKLTNFLIIKINEFYSY